MLFADPVGIVSLQMWRRICVRLCQCISWDIVYTTYVVEACGVRGAISQRPVKRIGMSIEHDDDVSVSRAISFVTRRRQIGSTGPIPHEFSDLASVVCELLAGLLVSNMLKSVFQSQQILFLRRHKRQTQDDQKRLYLVNRLTRPMKRLRTTCSTSSQDALMGSKVPPAS